MTLLIDILSPATVAALEALAAGAGRIGEDDTAPTPQGGAGAASAPVVDVRQGPTAVTLPAVGRRGA